ncbi:MAG TPA: hypothetical protein VIM39_00930, partial [Candidatus Limnocylindrales bacterium]
MGQDVVELARDPDAFLTGPPPRQILPAPLCLERTVLNLFEIGSPASRRLAEDEAGDEPSCEPQGRDEVDHVASSEDGADRQETADDRDDRAGPCARVSSIGDRVE